MSVQDSSQTAQATSPIDSGNVHLVNGPKADKESYSPSDRTNSTNSYVRGVNELTEWWQRAAQDEINRTVPKAVEYGGQGAAQDLIWIGREMADTLGREVSDTEATELGIYFYLLGKLARWKAAVQEGRPVSDDTLFDMGVYLRMAVRNRDVGGWPFPPSGQ